MSFNRGLPGQAIIDGLSQGILIFDNANRLVMENVAAGRLLGADLKLLREEGWKAALMLFNTREANPENTLDAIRAKALASTESIRFLAYRSGERVPCWAAAVRGSSGDLFTMITIDIPDWAFLTEILDYYLSEVRDAIESTSGHAELIMQTLKRPKANDTVETMGKRVSGFAKLIDTHMFRLAMLTSMTERLEAVRTTRIRQTVQMNARKIVLADFFEDFIESLEETPLLDPESDPSDIRRRIKISMNDKVAISASPVHFSTLLRDILRNAIMYSMKATPIRISAIEKDHAVQIEIADEGYGIRSIESERVFAPFKRARQPQIISEFGYGLSLYLCKYEVEAMNGRIWFDSEEGVGTTFSLLLPAWTAQSSSGHS
jgi:signal transduction histidine kinase